LLQGLAAGHTLAAIDCIAQVSFRSLTISRSPKDSAASVRENAFLGGTPVIPQT
jgi:hypothetical protein